MRSSTRTHTHPPNHPPTHTTAIMNQTHTSLDPYTPLKDNQTVRSTKAFHNVEKEQHSFRGHPSRGRPSSRRRRPKQMARTDIPERERHEDGGPIRLSFPSQGHPPVPFVSAIRLLQFNSSKYTLASVRMQFIYLLLKKNKRKKIIKK